MSRQSSRSTANMDAIDCIVNTNDLALENDVIKREDDQRSKPRRDQRSNETSNYRSTRRSPPSVTRKRHPSPPSISASSSRSRNQHYSSQKHHRVSSSPSPPPLPQSSSRHHRPTRPVVSIKRPYPQSDSPRERRPPTHRSRPETSNERTIGDVLTSAPATAQSKATSKQDKGDLSFISEDESTRKYDTHSSGPTTIQSSNNKLHSTPSIPTLQPNPNESLLETSAIPQECEISLFAASMLSNPNTSSILPAPVNSPNDFMQTIDLISKYKSIQTSGNTNPQVENWSKQISAIIEKQIELQKIELAYREREIKLRERELAEREKRFNEKPIETTSLISMNSESSTMTKPSVIEEKTPLKLEIINSQDLTNVSPEESVIKTIHPPTLTRKNNGKSRFSPIEIDPSIFPSQETPVVELYSNDLEDNPSSVSLKTTIPKILAPSDPILPSFGNDLKVTSSKTSRKVEIQSGNVDQSTSKNSSHDLRLTLSKNRTKYPNHNDEQTEDNQSNNNDDKQQSHDYQQQRSITSISMEKINDDKRRPRQAPYSNHSNERSYPQGSKYGSNQKRDETNDSRQRVFEYGNSKSSRSTHKNNY